MGVGAFPITRTAAVWLRTDDLDAVCSRLGLDETGMSRVAPEGEILKWRLVDLEQGMTFGLPFFIHWDIPDRQHPGVIRAEHPGGAKSLSGVSIGGDEDFVDELQAWAPYDETTPDGSGITYVSKLHQGSGGSPIRSIVSKKSRPTDDDGPLPEFPLTPASGWFG
ncbi:MAG TPA: VOC family protein [Acidimicrobiia bacterium]|nr:VOC family protein [Acidimicrobiia bacterium]